MSLGQVARLEEKVAKQVKRVSKEQERLTYYQNQLQEAMFATFISHQTSSQLSFNQALEQAFGTVSQSQPLEFEERGNEE